MFSKWGFGQESSSWTSGLALFGMEPLPYKLGGQGCLGSGFHGLLELLEFHLYE